jgi:tetratricopeptide (TPR) repeat protein
MFLLRRNTEFVAALLCSAAAVWAQSEQTHQTVRHHPVAVTDNSAASALLDQAEALLAKGNFADAEPLLQQATAKDSKSYQAWYDLGYAEQALQRRDDAINAYRKSIEISPQVFETNLNLGLELAAANKTDEAVKYLYAATTLQPVSNPEHGKEHAWLALGELQVKKDPAAAEKSFLEASKLVPADPQPHLLLAELYENSGKLDLASGEYRQALSGAKGADRLQVLRGLVNIAVVSKQYNAAEADTRQYLALAPSDSQAHLLLGRLLAAQGKDDDALAELNRAGNNNDPVVLREKADLLVSLKRETDALPLYKTLVDQKGNDAQLRYDYGIALMHQKQWAPAEEQFLAAVKLSPGLARAYGDLAVVASDNQQYDLTLKALDVRAKLLGENPGTYFLRATALDHLRRYPEATQNYRQFLTVANGKYPDEEWKARHRLIAIQNLK